MIDYFFLGYCFCAITYIFYSLCDLAMGFRMKYKLKLKNSCKEHSDD